MSFNSLFNRLFGAPAPVPAQAEEKPAAGKGIPDYFERTRHKLIDFRGFQSFGPLAEETISIGRTRHYYDRLLTIYQAAFDLQRRNAGRKLVLAELGVFKGGTAKFLITALEEFGCRDVEFHLFDTFEGHAAKDIDGKYDRTDKHVAGLFGDTSLEGVKEYLQPTPGLVFHQGRFADTCDQAADVVFDYAHLDFDLYHPLVQALNFFSTRIRPGGWIVVDDYGFDTCPGAKQAVDEFVAQDRQFASVLLFSGQYLLIKL